MDWRWQEQRRKSSFNYLHVYFRMLSFFRQTMLMHLHWNFIGALFCFSLIFGWVFGYFELSLNYYRSQLFCYWEFAFSLFLFRIWEKSIVVIFFTWVLIVSIAIHVVHVYYIQSILQKSLTLDWTWIDINQTILSYNWLLGNQGGWLMKLSWLYLPNNTFLFLKDLK